MNVIKTIFVFLSFGITAVNGAGAITGRVVNSSSAALAYAKVWLKNNPAVADSTGADGTFTLLTTTTAPRTVPRGNSPEFSVHNNRLYFTLNTSQKTTIEVFDILGKKAALMFSGTMHQGDHSIALAQKTQSLTPGTYLLRCAGEKMLFEAKVFYFDMQHTSPARMSNMRVSCHSAEKSAAAADSLIVLRMGYEIKKMALASEAAQNVGDISLKARTYKKETTVTVKTGRNIEIILPSDYNELYSLPVLYLLHGGGTDETTWRVYGHLIDTLNKFADKENMQAMIIITPNAGGSTGYGYYGKTADPFYTDLTVDIKNYVESHYKVDTARYSRAISGLSMGSMQTLNLTLFYPKLWGYSFPMSAGLLKNGGFSVAKLKADVQNKVIDTAAVNQLKIFKVFSNPTDIAYGDTDTTCMLMKELGIRHLTDFTTKTSGGHTFPFWNEVVRKYAPTLFK